MKLLFLGLLFLTLDIRLDVGSIAVNFLPEFIGYYLMYKGFLEMQEGCPRFRGIKPWVMGLGIYSGVLFAVDLLGIALGGDLIMWILRLLATIARFYVTYTLARGMADLQAPGSEKLMTMWQYWAIFATVSHMVSWLPLVGMVALVAAGILAIGFVVAFYKLWKAWEQEK